MPGRIWTICALAACVSTALATGTIPNGTINTLRQIDGALEQYQLENHKLPTTGEGLSEAASN
jgi:hypothetical protein